MIETISQVSIPPEIILFTAICVGLVISLATLYAALGAMREGRRVSKTLKERLARVEHDLLRAIGLR
jgi:hypothetical protein